VQILNDNFDKLKQIADMLMEFETLERADLDKIMDGTFDVAAKKKEIETVEVTSRREPPPLPQAVVSKKSRKKPLTDQMKPI
jgi:hypothetical protein